ncbi:MAG: hypothetical protein H7263_03645 [Candidatus Sericytochromatia bacterium]|nr:hypothetical protein [Candidatus Sericytochromatia bacterium]
MRDWQKENLIDFVKGEEESLEMFGDYIKDKSEISSMVYDIEEIAEQVVKKVDEGLVADFDYTDESLEAIEKMVDDAFGSIEDANSDLSEIVEDMVFDLGAYLGITLINSLGGAWRFRADFIHSSIHFPSIDSECFPFHRVARRLLHGKSESLIDFYDALVGIFDVAEY